MNARFVGGPRDGRILPIPEHQAADLTHAYLRVGPIDRPWQLSGHPVEDYVTEYRFTRMGDDGIAIFEVTA